MYCEIGHVTIITFYTFPV